MHNELEEVNSLYLQVQDYFDPLPSTLLNLSENHWIELAKNKAEYTETYNLALEKVKLILPTLSTTEVINAYNEGCRLLQRNLSGHMAKNFHDEYVPIMINAVKEPHLHTAWIFLQALANNLGQNIGYLAIEALNIKGLTETALSVVEQLNLREALPTVERLTQNENPHIALIAIQVKHVLEK